MRGRMSDNLPTFIAQLMAKRFAETDFRAVRVVRSGGRCGGPP